MTQEDLKNSFETFIIILKFKTYKRKLKSKFSALSKIQMIMTKEMRDEMISINYLKIMLTMFHHHNTMKRGVKNSDLSEQTKNYF